MSKNLNPIEIITPAFRFIPALKSIAEYLKLIESLNSKIDRLNDTPLNAAIRNLKYAEKTSRDNKTRYIVRAKDKFIDAITVESHTFDNSYRIFAAYYGLALCQYQLEDLKNAIDTLNEYATMDLKDATGIEENNITKVKVSWSKKRIVQVRGFLLVLFLFTFALVLGIIIPIFAVPLGIYGIYCFRFNKNKKNIHKILNKLDKSLPFGLRQKELFLLHSQKKAADFAKEIKNKQNTFPYFLQKVFIKLFNKKELKRLRKQWEYFKNVKEL